jgi:hypothetical protein
VPAAVRRFPAIAGALLVLIVTGTGLTAAHKSSPESLPSAVAIHDALHAPGLRQILVGSHWTTVRESPIGGGLTRVSFLAGGSAVAEVALRANGSADAVQALGHGLALGNTLGYQPLVLIGLSLLFFVMVGVTPLWRLRNLDVIAALSLTVSVPLFQRGELSASVIVVVPGLLYLLSRATYCGLGPHRAAPDSAPVLDRLLRHADVEQRARLLRLLLLALVLMLVLIGVGTTTVADIPYAVMEGATVLTHGLLPYGHMPGDVIHGDTYPVLSYVLYVPVAWVAPVHSTWDSITGALVVSTLAALAVAAGLLRAAAGRRPARGRRAPIDEVRGLRAAIAWLSFPLLMTIVSTGTTDVPLVAMLVFAVLLWRSPAASTGLLALAGWFKFAPFALVPLWIAPRRGRALVLAVAPLAFVTAAALLLVLGIGGVHGLTAMVHAMSYQFDRGSLQSVWQALGIRGLQPVGQAAALALITGVSLELRRRPALAQDKGRVAALAGAVLIALQLVSNYWSFLYLAWFVPLLGLSLFAEPSTGSDVQPLPNAGVQIPSGPDPSASRFLWTH